MSLHKDNILILSVSRKTLLCRWFIMAARKYGLGVLGSDINLQSPALSIMDDIIELPNLEDQSFIDEILGCIQKNRIKLIIPTRDDELLFLPRYVKEFKSAGCMVLCNSTEVAERMIDKEAFNHFCVDELGNSDLRVINITSEVKDQDFPLFFRGINGQTTMKIRINNQAELKASFLLFPYGLATTHLNGLEVSIDCYVSKEGRIIYIVPRTRDVVLGSESIVTTTIESQSCYTVAEKLLLKGGIRGPAVLQGMVDGTNFTPFEINLRFGGASVLAFKAAFSGPELALKEYIVGDKLTEFYKYKKQMVLFKDFKETYKIK
jgi:carbamoyl-phosphate synthase large subunit